MLLSNFFFNLKIVFDVYQNKDKLPILQRSETDNRERERQKVKQTNKHKDNRQTDRKKSREGRREDKKRKEIAINVGNNCRNQNV